MKLSIEKLIKDFGTISIDNLTSTEEPITEYGLYTEEPCTGRILVSEKEQNNFYYLKGGKDYAKKKSNTNPG